MKKIVFIFCLLIGLTGISCASDLYTDYDFSDAAQEEFDRQHETPVNTLPNADLEIKKEKKSIQDKYETPIEAEVKRTEYVLPEIQGELPSQYNMVTIPQGAILYIKLKSSVSSGSLDKGDGIMAELAYDFVYNNRLIAPKGSIVNGVVEDADAAGYAYRGSSLEIAFRSIITPAGTMMNIETENLKLEQKEINRGKNILRDTAIGTGLGLLGGLAWAALSGDWAGGLAIAGGIGLAGGALVAVSQHGEDVVIQPDTIIELVLSKPINAPLYLENEI